MSQKIIQNNTYIKLTNSKEVIEIIYGRIESYEVLEIRYEMESSLN